ncbi:MAG TPA: MdtA/MuxA family multidrug efflux RND transporter periplasmic adaptor subunit [Candidatus Sulfopaludibacter sp.]|jgi:multidrug efflux system membrane fusion protein|nr:MdtA/MuxA family multidrug efflux RND transporter periplasmic adaptor subunit [Candidatus Sulfopaludibacter sp.]
MNQKTPTVPEHVSPAPPNGGDSTRPPKGAKRSSGKGWIWLLVLIAAAAAAYYYWPKGEAAQAGTAPSGGGAKKGRGAGGLPPVVAVKATRGNIGVYLDGLGSVTPIYTVTVKSRVDGQLMAINYKEGDVVQKGQPLIELDPRPFEVALEQAEGQLARDKALLNNARVDLTRYQTLLSQNAIPEQQLSTQKALVEQYEGTIKTDQGAIDSAKLNITYCHITAPITGKVGLRLVDPGNIVHASDQTGLLVITQMEPISVIFPIAEDHLSPVAKRHRAGQKLTVEAWDRDKTNKIATGALETLDNQIDQTTGTLKLRALFDNKDNALYPNQFVNARLLVEEKRGVVLLPTAAIQRTSATIYVWMLKPDSTVTVRNITVGTTEGDQTEITSGLAAGDSVIMTGVDKLNEGSKVNVSGGEGGRGGRGSSAEAPSGVGSGVAADAPTSTDKSGKGGRRGNKSGGQGK